MGNAGPTISGHKAGSDGRYEAIEKDLENLFNSAEEMNNLFKTIATFKVTVERTDDKDQVKGEEVKEEKKEEEMEEKETEKKEENGKTKEMDRTLKRVHTSGSSITLENLMCYINSLDEHSVFKKLAKNSAIVLEAHKFACKENHKEGDVHLLPRNRFKLLLCCMFYFSLLWDIFIGDSIKLTPNEMNETTVLDNDKIDIIIDKIASFELAAVADIDVSSKKIKKNEYMHIKDLVQCIGGSNIDMNTTIQNLERDFDKIDTEHKGIISFGEFCAYATQHISIADDDFAEYCKEYTLVNSEITSQYKEEPLPPLDFSSTEAYATSLHKQQSVQEMNSTYKNAKKVNQVVL